MKHAIGQQYKRSDGQVGTLALFEVKKNTVSLDVGGGLLWDGTVAEFNEEWELVPNQPEATAEQEVARSATEGQPLYRYFVSFLTNELAGNIEILRPMPISGGQDVRDIEEQIRDELNKEHVPHGKHGAIKFVSVISWRLFDQFPSVVERFVALSDTVQELLLQLDPVKPTDSIDPAIIQRLQKLAI